MKNPVTTRLALAAAAAALVVAACSGSSATQAPGLTPVSGGTLTVAIDSGPTYADPSLDSDPGTLLIANQVVEGLVGIRPGTTSDVVPVLAAALPTASPDGLTWTAQLRTGIKFQDGTALNAKAVKANYDRWLAFAKGDLQNHATSFLAAFGGFGDQANLSSVDAPDDTTVVFHLREPQSDFLLSQTSPSFGIQSPTAIAANQGNNASLGANIYASGTGGKGTAMVGTGPFILSDWKSGDEATVVRNPDYWNASGRAYLDQVVFKLIASPTERTAALKSGSVDLVETLDPAAVTSTTANKDLLVYARGSSCQAVQLYMNQGSGFGKVNVLSSTQIRNAIAAALQKDSYASAFYAGGAAAADSWIPAGVQYYKREYLPNYDLSQARKWIAQSGLAASLLSIQLAYPATSTTAVVPDAKGLATAISRDLQAVGFKVTLQEEAADAFAGDAANGKLQMFVSGARCRWASADAMLGTFRFVNGSPQPSLNYNSPQVDQEISAAQISPTDDAAKTAWEGVQDQLRQDMPTVPLLDVMLQAGARSYVAGFLGSGLELENLATVWLNK